MRSSYESKPRNSKARFFSFLAVGVSLTHAFSDVRIEDTR